MPTNNPQLDLNAGEQAPALITHGKDPVARMLSAVIDKGVTQESVGALKELCALYERMQDRDAERQFAEAFVKLQAELPRVQAVRPVPDKHGNVKYHFAPYEDIMDEIRPFLEKHGFGVTFSSDFRDGRVFQTCTLQHAGGHKKSNTFGARIGSGPPGSSDAQGDGAASTYAKRFALCDALNITITKDVDGANQDARSLGAFIVPDKVQYLREQIRELGGDAKNGNLFKMAGVEIGDYEAITEAIYPVLVRAIDIRREKGGK